MATRYPPEFRRRAVELARRRFVADAPDRLWLTDITEHPTREGKVYCAAVLDVYSRRIVGWSRATASSTTRRGPTRRSPSARR